MSTATEKHMAVKKKTHTPTAVKFS